MDSKPGDKAIQYLFKYQLKGSGQALISIKPENSNFMDEVEVFQNKHYISSMEASWKILVFPIVDVVLARRFFDSKSKHNTHISTTSFLSILFSKQMRNGGNTCTFAGQPQAICHQLEVMINERDPNSEQYFESKIPTITDEQHAVALNKYLTHSMQT
jgi:hypothetical protein